MKNLINKTFNTLLILLSISILGIFIPLIVSFFISILTPATFLDCSTTVPFWLFTVIGWIASAVYVNDIITDKI
jgi:tryptophan-rich sensory protein